MRLLVVEDEPALADAVAEALRREAYAVDVAADGEAASELAAVNDYDAIVLDWTIPPPSGLELLHEWRDAGLETPVLMLTGRTEVDDRVGGLDAGADDYLTKPFSMQEMLARVRSLLRRQPRALATDLEAGPLKMERAAHRVTVGGRAIDLSPKEFGLLEYLLHRKGEVVTRTDLAEHVWDDSFDSFSNVIDVTVHRLRKKIETDDGQRLLRTVAGVGYVLQGDPEPDS